MSSRMYEHCMIVLFIDIMINDPESMKTLGQRSFSVVDSVGPTLETDVGLT